VPPQDDRPADALRLALAELAACADRAGLADGAGRAGHECDVRFGRDVVRVLAQAQRQIDARLTGA
jgi:hypothetical protein